MTRICMTGAVLVFGAIIVSSDNGQKPSPSDPFPNGCVSCHGKTPDGKDVRLNVAIKLVKGHPSVASIVKTVPNDCGKCHKPGGKTPTLDVAVHKAHFGKGDKSVFVKEFKGDCTACHTLDAKTFKMGVKSGPKNW